MAEYQVWLVTPAEVQMEIPALEKTEPRPDAEGVQKFQDEEFEILIPNIKYRNDAITCMNALKMEKEVGNILKLVEKKDGGKYAIRDWMPCQKPVVEFDPSAAAQEAAAGEGLHAEGSAHGTHLALVPGEKPNHQYPPNTRKKKP